MSYEVEYYELPDGSRPAEEGHPDQRICEKDPEDTPERNRKSQAVQSRSSAERGELNNGKENFRETLNEQMKDPEFRAEWEAQEPERQIMHAILEGRQNCNLTQEQLAQVTGINQANISRLENGTANPSLRTLKRLAEGMGMELKLEFVPRVQPQH